MYLCKHFFSKFKLFFVIQNFLHKLFFSLCTSANIFFRNSNYFVLCKSCLQTIYFVFLGPANKFFQCFSYPTPPPPKKKIIMAVPNYLFQYCQRIYYLLISEKCPSRIYFGYFQLGLSVKRKQAVLFKRIWIFFSANQIQKKQHRQR